MNSQQIRTLREINRKILYCRKCSVHTELEKLREEGLYYRPDAPLYDPQALTKNDFRVISIGLNPAWDDEYMSNIIRRDAYVSIYKSDVRTDDQYDSYFNEMNKIYQASTRREQYRNALTKTFNLINERLSIYEGINKISPKDIYDYLFWSNLSWCNSQKVNKRVFWHHVLPCNVLHEEIPNCLGKGYLKEIVNCIKPELLLFFGSNVPFDLQEKIAGNIFDVSKDSFSLKKKAFTAHLRSNSPVMIDISVCFSREGNVKMIFLPHPNYRWLDEYRIKAITWACNELLN